MMSFAFPDTLLAGECRVRPGGGGGQPDGLPRLQLKNFEYKGAFTFADKGFGMSGPSFSNGLIQYSNGALFMSGYAVDDAIAEYPIPELVASGNLKDIPFVDSVVQGYVQVLNRGQAGNPDNLDTITGMGMIDGKLIINAAEYYDADGGATDTTLVIENPDDLAGSPVRGFLKLPGAARSAGWISPVPEPWQKTIGAPFITGNSSNIPITSRHSMGPSAHSLKPADLDAATIDNPQVKTVKMMEFSLAQPLHPDLNNESGDNNLWHILSGAWYGFIVPDSSTYAVFGQLSGSSSGIGYKITQSDGHRCSGFCSYDAGDIDPYYWLFDVRDLVDVKNGLRSASSIRPYEYGVFPAPFQPEVGAYGINGGTFDETSGTLYLSLAQANTGQFHRIPVIVAYGFR